VSPTGNQSRHECGGSCQFCPAERHRLANEMSRSAACEERLGVGARQYRSVCPGQYNSGGICARRRWDMHASAMLTNIYDMSLGLWLVVLI
jgi:hypothetical protein